jgi:hypothetical protein
VVALAVWGLGTRVRRRLFFGAGIAVAAVLLLIVVPTAVAAPSWHGASHWIGVAVLGLAAMVVAAALEQGHVRFHQLIVHLGQILHDWE